MWCGVAGRDKKANESLWQVCTGLSRLCVVCVLIVHKCVCVYVGGRESSVCEHVCACTFECVCVCMSLFSVE